MTKQKSHQIKTIKDLCDLTTADNVAEMIVNVTEWLTLVANLKELGVPFEVQKLQWVEDGQAGVSEVNVVEGK